MNVLTYLFLLILAANAGLRLWLARRQIQHVRAHRQRVPQAFHETIPLDAHRKAADYTIARTRLGMVERLLGIGIVLAWTLGGGLDFLDQFWHRLPVDPLTLGVGVIVSLMLINALLELPVNVYDTFVLEARFGFNRTRSKTFLLDIIKGFAIALLLGIPLAYAALWLMHATGSLWWIWVWALWLAFTLVVTWAYPAVIAPLFNKFTPLGDNGLKTRIEALLARCGFRSNGIFIMDGSTRSAHGNAYFTGLGRNKRIVFFDTLMDKLEPGEIEAVLAHELGHFSRHHVIKRWALSAALSLAGLALLGWLSTRLWFYSGLGVTQPSAHAALLLFLLAGTPFLFLLQPLGAALSRRHEFEADAYAADQADGRALIGALLKLYRDNASTLTPDPLHSLFYDSHPPATARIGYLTQLCEQRA